MLDGAVLTRTRSGFVFSDGTPVSEERRREIVFVAREQQERETPSTGLVDALRAIGESDAHDDLDIDAGFFHRTLARWLGLPEGRAPGQEQAPIVWDYAFWKAELVASGDDGERSIFEALVHRSADAAPEHYRYWVVLDARGRISHCGWLGPVPRLLDDTMGAFASRPVDEAAVAALYRDEP